MTRRLLGACLGAAFVAALLVHRAAAKPPDLPMNEEPIVGQPAEPVEEAPPPAGGAIVPEAEPSAPACTPPASTPLQEHPLIRLLADDHLLGWVTLEEGASGRPQLAEAIVPPALYRLRPRARQCLTSSFLLTVHPFLALAPVARFLDAPCDHPRQVAGADIFTDMPEERFDGSHRRICVADNRTWWDWLMVHWVPLYASPQQREGHSNEIDTSRLLTELTPAYSSDCCSDESEAEAIATMPEEDGEILTAIPTEEEAGVLEDMPAEDEEEETLPAPTEDETKAVPDGHFTCPYLREQAARKRAQVITEPEVTRDVVSNLELLMAADRLCEVAAELQRCGHVCEAIHCLALASKMCPGSHCEERAILMAADMIASLCELKGEESATEEQEGDDVGEPSWIEHLLEWGRLNVLPINVYSSDPNRRILKMLEESEDLRVIEAEWKQIWPECVDHLGTCNSHCTKAALEELLRKPVTLNFQDVPLRQVLADLRHYWDLPVVLDERAIAQGGILDRPVTFQVEEVAMKPMLSLLLRPHGLAWVAKDCVVQVTTKEKAAGQPVNRSYAIADLLDAEKLYSAIKKKPCEPKQESCAEELIVLITATIEPNSWSARGGRGTIDYFPPTHSLLVTQTVEVQDQVQDLLDALRRFVETEQSVKETKSCSQPSCPEACHGSCPAVCPASHERQPGVEEQVSGLMKACRQAMSAGLHEKAADLARQAYALDPDAVMADPLVYKMHLLSHQYAPPAAEESACPACPADKPADEPADDRDSDDSVQLKPHLPPVDPDVVPALEDVLTQEGEKPARLTVTEEHGSTEEQETEEVKPVDVMGLLDMLSPGTLEIGCDLNRPQLRLMWQFTHGGSTFNLSYTAVGLVMWKTDAPAALPKGKKGE